MITRFALRIVLGVVIAGVYGCAVKRERYDVPPVPVPAQFKQAAAVRAELEPKPAAAGASAQTRTEPLVGALLVEWWRVLANPELDALIDRVLANNTDLRIATLRIVQTKARADQAMAGQWPTLSVPYEAKGEGPKNGIGSGRPGAKIDTLHTYQMSLRADWRVDLWGEKSALVDSSRMQLLRSTYERDDTRRQLIANTTTLYIEYLSLNDRIRVARETEVVLRGLLEAVSKRVEVGDATITDLEQQRTAVYAVQATIPALELQREIISNALAQLLGVTPVSLALSDRGLDSLNFPSILPGVPAGLVLRRPDVRVVEARLLSADADIDVARARLLPPLDLTAQAGYGSYALSQLFQPHNLFWNAIANISATIFDRGKRSNEVVFSKAVHEELVETYVKVIYNAVRETEDAIATIQMNGKRMEAQKSSADAAQRAWNFSMESYSAGAVDYLTLIDTERTYHRSLDEFHRIRMERLKGVASLFSALGGGIPQADAMPYALSKNNPSGGDRSAANVSSNRNVRPYSQYVPNASDDDKEYWMVEITGLHDRHGITHVWRDLNRRFPDLMQERSMLPRLQGRVALDGKERASWYRVYVARFDDSAVADGLCNQLVKELQRCRVTSSLDSDFIASREVALEEIQVSQEFFQTAVGAPGQTSGIFVDILSDLIVPLTLQPVAAGDAGRPVTIAARPRTRIAVDDGFLPALVVPALVDPAPTPAGAKP